MMTRVHSDMRVKYARSGFTLMEILIAILIVGIVGAMAIPAFFNIYKKQQIRVTKQQLRITKGEVDKFRLHTNQYPAKLKDLVTKPKSGDERVMKKWEGPYLEKEPEDAWGEKFFYKVTPTSGKRPYEMYSYGPEGKGGGSKEDQINVWDLD